MSCDFANDEGSVPPAASASAGLAAALDGLIKLNESKAA